MEFKPTRRHVLAGLFAAPAVIAADRLMPVRSPRPVWPRLELQLERAIVYARPRLLTCTWTMEYIQVDDFSDDLRVEDIQREIDREIVRECLRETRGAGAPPTEYAGAPRWDSTPRLGPPGRPGTLSRSG